MIIYITYHLLREPETAIDFLQESPFFDKKIKKFAGLPIALAKTRHPCIFSFESQPTKYTFNLKNTWTMNEDDFLFVCMEFPTLKGDFPNQINQPS